MDALALLHQRGYGRLKLYCYVKEGLGAWRHTLRHTAITRLVQAGVDFPTVKRISGHTNLSMVERYSHQNGAHFQSAMDKLSERYNSKAS